MGGGEAAAAWTLAAVVERLVALAIAIAALFGAPSALVSVCPLEPVEAVAVATVAPLGRVITCLRGSG